MSARVHLGSSLPEGHDDADHQGRGKGRPSIGGEIRQELGDDLKAEVETYALDHNTRRAAAIRKLVRRGLDLELDPMARMVVVDGDELNVLLTHLHGDGVHRVRFAFDDGLKVKVNEEQWSISFGHQHDSASADRQ
ncbi:hypothetical protein [Amycolatopsis vastitatis]|uniref:hypothetical protein n=1 Tax=Amycolatopsis vastitatis TaxID=1905142 RepID=UPI0011776ED5|nr:hypothetical protein [Amycolatopsis vastitatis]